MAPILSTAAFGGAKENFEKTVMRNSGKVANTDTRTASSESVRDVVGDKSIYDYGNYSSSDFYTNARIYSYDFLVAQKDMAAVKLPDTGTLTDSKGKIDINEIVRLGKKNALLEGEERGGKIYVRNTYTGRELRVDNSTIRHGLDGTYRRLLTNARIGSVIGTVVKNAIPINGLKNTSPNAVGTYAMVSFCNDSQNREFIVVVVVEQQSRAIDSFELFDVAHAVSGRQKNSSQVDTKSQGVNPIKATTISIADLLNIVNSTHQSILSDNVLSHLGENRAENGSFSDKVLFSDRVTSDEEKQYLELAKHPEKNKARLREMVDEAAKRAGFNERLYHQTQNDFNVFDTHHKGAGTRDNETPFGIFMKKSSTDIGLKGNKQIPLFARFQNPLIAENRTELVQKLESLSSEYRKIKSESANLDIKYKRRFDEAKVAFREWLTKWRENNPNAKSSDAYNDPGFDSVFSAEEKILKMWTRESSKLDRKAKDVITDTLKKSGYDGIILQNDIGSFGRKTDTYIALDPEQVKSADLVTYDDEGNIIPLSERFRTDRTDAEAWKNEDIRYSERDFPIDVDIAKTVSDAVKNRGKGGNHILSEITPEQNKAINRLAVNNDYYRGKFTGGKHFFTDNFINHALKEHGDFLVEGLRGQLPIANDDVARNLTAIRQNKKPSLTISSKTRTGNASILTVYKVNGYTLYAEEILRPSENNKVGNLIGHTMYKAPTLSTAAFNTTSVVTQPERQGTVLCEYNNTRKNGLSRGNFISDKAGNPAALKYVITERGIDFDARSGLIALSSDEKNFTKTGETVETGYVLSNKHFYITARNTVFRNSEENYSAKVRELKQQGYDSFIFDYNTGDNYMVAVVNKAQIVTDKPAVVENERHSDRDTSLDPRTLLTNALENAAVTEDEKNFLKAYKNRSTSSTSRRKCWRRSRQTKNFPRKKAQPKRERRKRIRRALCLLNGYICMLRGISLQTMKSQKRSEVLRNLQEEMRCILYPR